MQDRAALATALGLNHTEIQILLRLVAWGQLAREQVCGIPVSGHRQIKPGSVGAVVRGLRKKLAEHKIKIDTVNGFGFELRKDARAKGPRAAHRPSPAN